jgi:2'-5' RNA ligase
LRERNPQVRWLPPDSLHLTVLFLGGTLEARLPELRGALDEVATLQRPFEIRTDAGGGRVGQPGRGGIGVAWLNLDRGADETANLATALSVRLQTGTAWPAKGHAPHLTVARRATFQLVRALRDPAAVAAVNWTCDRVVLFASDLGHGVPRYDTLHEARLTGA